LIDIFQSKLKIKYWCLSFRKRWKRRINDAIENILLLGRWNHIKLSSNLKLNSQVKEF